MKETQDYLRDLAEIRTMMERSSKFLSLSGWAGILAGLYALAGAHIAYWYIGFNPDGVFYTPAEGAVTSLVILAAAILSMAIVTALYVSFSKARKKGERAWNPVSKKLLGDMAVPLITGGTVVLILLSKGMLGLIAPVMLVFYGLALYNAGRYTFAEIRYMGMVQLLLGVVGLYYYEYGLVFWAAGFGLVHLVYGIYMYFRYDK